MSPCTICTCTGNGFRCEDNQCEITAENNVTITTTSPLTSTSTVTATSTTILARVPVDGDESTCHRTTNGGRDDSYLDCSEIFIAGKKTTGIYEIWPRTSSRPFKVLCDMDTDGGGWTVFQKRGDYIPQTNFFTTWASYKRGFGDLQRDFWLGNEKIYYLSNQDEYRLRIDLEDFQDQKRFVEYEWFFITGESMKYTLNLGRFIHTSSAGDSLSYNRGMRFTTKDQDNDASTSQCAENYKSGWWYAGCTLTNLNGLYLRGNDSTATGIFWNNWLGAKYSLKVSEMKIRPISFNSEMLSY
ncbi:unnamed protein product [Didymodactylos carnosus]|uniref:Fibrinogen C-terminal domain-containing protein n=1 Tax=Didymodactylos carnosus TaxID=1234261 RepID=A0A813RZU4_9BILA|nr:unnamed protein product [Didymodactylos carnosus]CAF1198634.1 unnamed protein product [Didymodactylos carnosus]CAF3571905.1 unnamed protein product [Didymodactylos carnosus]CAF4008877.1 unnamed protein product [Didymodactylos carnosus]